VNGKRSHAFPPYRPLRINCYENTPNGHIVDIEVLIAKEQVEPQMALCPFYTL